jgi:DNA-binding SARP family transcriptional activator/streptogramin lyase
MKFSILGPLEVHDGIGPVALGGGQQRRLLAILLLHANEMVTTDHLVEELWGSRPPGTAAKALQGYVSQLRKRLGQEAVETVGSGYRLRVEPDDLDARRFEALLAEARTLDRAAAAVRLREALALWRGPPLADFTYDAFARNEINRLEELRLSCIERRVDLELALGHHDDLVPELEALVRELPLRERLRRHLIVALYRSGRQADALDAYQDARAALRDELGLDPSDELQALQRAILAHDPSLAAPPRVELPRAERPAAAERAAKRRIGPRTLVVVGAVVLVGALTAALVSTFTGGGHAPPVTVPPNFVALVDTHHDRLTSFVGVGQRPVAVAVGAGGVWVTNADDGTVDRLDPATGKVVRTIGIGADVNGVATGFGSVWVADGNDGTVTRIDPSVNQVERTIAPAGPATLATNPIFFVATDTRYVWVTQGDELLRIDPRTNEVDGRVAVGAATALATGGGSVWITTTSSRLVRVDPRTLRTTAAEDLSDHGVAAVYGEGALWLVVGSYPGTVEQVDPVTLAASPVPTAMRFPAVLAVGGGSIWIADARGVVERVDARTGNPLATLRLGTAVTSAVAVPGRLWLTFAAST